MVEGHCSGHHGKGQLFVDEYKFSTWRTFQKPFFTTLHADSINTCQDHSCVGLCENAMAGDCVTKVDGFCSLYIGSQKKVVSNRKIIRPLL